MASLTDMLHFRATLADSDAVSEACRVRAVWTSPVKTYLSMAVRKGAPYAKLLATAQLKSLESGYYYRELGQQMPVGAGVTSASSSTSSDSQVKNIPVFCSQSSKIANCANHQIGLIL